MSLVRPTIDDAIVLNGRAGGSPPPEFLVFFSLKFRIMGTTFMYK